MYSAILVALLLIVILWLLPRRRDFITVCDELMRNMPANQYETLSDLVDTDPTRNDEVEFWRRTDGVAGLMVRLRTSMTYLRLVQAHYRAKRIDKSDARVIWRKLVRQMVFTFVALPEAVVCRYLKDFPHVAARASLRFYCELVIRTNVLCVIKDAPKCLLRLPELL